MIELSEDDLDIARSYFGEYCNITNDDYIRMSGGKERLTECEFIKKYPYALYIAQNLNTELNINCSPLLSGTSAYNPHENKLLYNIYNESIVLHELSHLIHHCTVEDIWRDSYNAREIIAETCSYVSRKMMGKRDLLGSACYILSYATNEPTTFNHRIELIKKAWHSHEDKILKIVNYILDAQKEVGYGKACEQ